MSYTVPGLGQDEGRKVSEILQDRLNAFNDLHLTLKHAHWNVVGPNFIGVHEMLDPQVELVRGYADAVAERIATLGGAPIGVPGRSTYQRPWDEYTLDKGTTLDHIAALDKVYAGLIASQRAAIADVGDIDPITEDMLIGQSAELEQFQWFLRAHLEDAAGNVPS
ncbi:DNA starvation/stationary phase protection protein [Brevibacterium samyangense]|uniref:DNA starvation/stationary phase protection protein n=2 Tax=Brevibacterium samyangense TaxID=366888 RepID=A0ABP5F3D7_9MICO